MTAPVVHQAGVSARHRGLIARAAARMGRPSYRRTLLAAALNLVLIWAMAAVVIWQNYRQSTDDLKTSIENLSLTVAAHVAQAQRDASLILTSVANWVHEEGIDSEEQFRSRASERRLFDVMRDRVVGAPQVGLVAVLASNGDLLNSLIQWPAVPANVADREGFRAAMAETPPRVVITSTARGSDGRYRFFLVRKLTSRSGAVLGAAAVGLDADYFADFFRSIALGSDGWLSLYRSDGTLLATSLADLNLLGQRHDRSPTYRMIEGGRSGRAALTDEAFAVDPARGLTRIAVARPVEGFATYVTVVAGESGYRAAWRERTTVVVGIAIFLTLLTAGATLRILQLIDRSEAIQRAESERQVLAAIVDTPSALTAIIGKDGAVLHCNRRFRELLDGKEGGRNALLNPALRGADRLTAFAVGEGQGTAEIDLELDQPGQTRRLHFSLSRQSLPDSGDCVVLVGHDETERYQAQQAIAMTARLVTLGEITTSIAHELSQPLNVIRMAAQNALLEAKPEPAALPGEQESVPPMSDAEFRGFAVAKFDRIVRQVDRAAKVLTRMRIFSRKPSQEVTAFDVTVACRHALALLASQLRRDGIAVAERFPEEPLTVRAPETLMEQAVIFLVRNAREALIDSDQPNKVIEVSARQAANRRVVIQVSDNGPGVPDAIRDRIFEPFFSTKPSDRHAGLGLTLAFGAMRDAGGELRLAAGQPGAAFEIELPQGQPDAGAATGRHT